MIVGIGELLWDVFPDGRKVAGGAPFNFAFHCKQLGHDAAIVSRVGDDDLGRELREEVRRLGLPDEFIQTDPDHPTGTVRVTVDAHGQPAYTITEDVAWDYIGWDEWLDRLARTASAVCFGTLAQRSTQSRTTIGRLLGWRFEGSAPVRAVAPVGGGANEESATTPLRIFDVNLRQHYHSPKAIQLSLFLSDWVKVNKSEAGTLYGIFKRVVPDYETFLKKLVPLDGPRAVILTDGATGCRALSEQEDFREPGVPARVVD